MSGSKYSKSFPSEGILNLRLFAAESPMAVHPGVIAILVHTLLSVVQLQATGGGTVVAGPIPLGLGILGGRCNFRTDRRILVISVTHVLPKVITLKVLVKSIY